MIIKYWSWFRPPLAHHNWSLKSFWDLYVPCAVKLYSNNKDFSTRRNPLWTNWIISGELQSDLPALAAVLLMSSVLVNAALAFSYGLIDISLEPFYLWFEWLVLSQHKPGLLAGLAGGSCFLDILSVSMWLGWDLIKKAGFMPLPFGYWFTRTWSH